MLLKCTNLGGYYRGLNRKKLISTYKVMMLYKELGKYSFKNGGTRPSTVAWFFHSGLQFF
jgi:hypothetical protein